MTFLIEPLMERLNPLVEFLSITGQHGLIVDLIIILLSSAALGAWLTHKFISLPKLNKIEERISKAQQAVETMTHHNISQLEKSTLKEKTAEKLELLTGLTRKEFIRFLSKLHSKDKLKLTWNPINRCDLTEKKKDNDTSLYDFVESAIMFGLVSSVTDKGTDNYYLNPMYESATDAMNAVDKSLEKLV